MVEELARLVEHRDLAARAVARVERDDARAAHRAGGEQPLEVLGKDLDGIHLRADSKAGAQLALKRGCHEALVAVGDGSVEDRGEGSLAARPAAPEARHGRLHVHPHAHAELLLPLAAVDGQDAVVGNLARRLGEVVVGLVGGLLARVHRNGDDVGRALGEGSQVGHVLRVLRHRLGHDVGRPGERLLRRVEPGLGGLGRHKGRGRLERAALLGRDLHDDHVGERLQPRLAGLLGAGHALLAVGLVEVLDALELGGRANLRLELGGELALGVDENDDILLALLEVAQVGKAVVERAQGDVVHAARRLLAVARDEGDGVPLVDEVDGGLDRGGLEPKLLRERGDDVHVGSLGWVHEWIRIAVRTP